MTPDPGALFADPRLTPLLPMIYMAWADGDLTGAELDHIRDVGQTWLDGDGVERLGAWLDPASPPSVTGLMKLLGEIRTRSRKLPKDERFGLAELGMRIATIDADASATGWLTPEVANALEELEVALGFVGPGAVRAFSAQPEIAPELASQEAEPAFDVVRMTTVIDGPHHARKARVRRYLADHPDFRYAYDLDTDTQRARVTAWLEALAADGYGELAYPGVMAHGDLGEFVATFEGLAYFEQSLVVKYGVQFGLFGGSVFFLGTQKHHDAYLERIARGELLGCFAMTELGHGSNVRDLQTVARYDHDTDSFDLHTPDELARKDWIGNAARDGEWATVFAQLEVDDTSHGVHAFLVPIRTPQGDPMPGVRIEDCGHKMGLNGVDNGRLWFDHVRVPRENLLDRYAKVTDEGEYTSLIVSQGKRFFTMLGTLVGGRVAIAGAALSAAKSALTIAVRYGARRRQFGPEEAPEVPILDYRTHQRRLMPRLARAYAVAFAHHALVERYVAEQRSEDRRQLEAWAAGLKAYSSWNTIDTIQTCREACGGMGYLAENRFGALKADTDIYATFEGDNVVLMQLVAKSALTKFRRQFSDESFFAVARFIARQTTSTLAERNPINARRTDREHLRSDDFQLGALRFREEHLVQTLARRLKARIDDDMDPFDAFNACQNHVLALGHAHVQSWLLERFIEAVAEVDDEAIRAQLEGLVDLFALTHIHEHVGWFMSNDLVEDAKARAIRAEVTALCAEVRQQALPLVDAFGIPDELLAAPIALGDGIPR